MRPTHLRGYDWRHKQARKQHLAAFTPGQPCTRCRLPILAPPVDLDHTDDRTSYLGLAHRSCNRAAGAHKRNRRHNRGTPRHSRNW